MADDCTILRAGTNGGPEVPCERVEMVGIVRGLGRPTAGRNDA